jgi:hypothetical protein
VGFRGVRPPPLLFSLPDAESGRARRRRRRKSLSATHRGPMPSTSARRSCTKLDEDDAARPARGKGAARPADGPGPASVELRRKSIVLFLLSFLSCVF